MASGGRGAAQPPSTPFTIHNLPYGVITSRGNGSRRCATAFLDYAVDLEVLYNEGVFKGIPLLRDNVFAHVIYYP